MANCTVDRQTSRKLDVLKIVPGMTESRSRSCYSRSPSGGAWTLSTGGWTTGRTSSYSLGDEEIENQTTQIVERLFRDIDNVLYESGAPLDGSQHLVPECNQWSAAFPHIRILGYQFLKPQDCGYHYIQIPATISSNQRISVISPGDIGDSYNKTTADNLAVHGTIARIHDTHRQTSAEVRHVSEFKMADDYSKLNVDEEEVMAEDGSFDDVIAVDFISCRDRDSVCRSCADRRIGLPSTTPLLCFKDNIVEAIFDCLWSDHIVEGFHPIVERCKQLVQNSALFAKETSDVTRVSAPVSSLALMPFAKNNNYCRPSTKDSFRSLLRESSNVSSSSKPILAVRVLI